MKPTKQTKKGVEDIYKKYQEALLRKTNIVGLVLGVSMLALAGCVKPLPPSGPPGVAFAAVSVKCGGDVYTVSTGNNSGKCSTSTGPGGQVETAQCDDGQGNSASVSCRNQVGACGGTTGSGNCEIKLP